MIELCIYLREKYPQKAHMSMEPQTYIIKFYTFLPVGQIAHILSALISEKLVR